MGAHTFIPALGRQRLVDRGHPGLQGVPGQPGPHKVTVLAGVGGWVVVVVTDGQFIKIYFNPIK